MNTIIGIDLGTSTTEAAVIRDGKPEIILNFDEEKVTPSVVGTDDSGNILVGGAALARQMIAPENTVIEIKRKMGLKERVRLGKTDFTPEQISAQILSYVRRFASEYTGEDITRAVISVPAYFDEIQRQATVEAGRQAGFTVERILNEPTAAALSYGLSHLDEESHILVYDLGGGTFDVTLLEMFGGVLEVKASNGDNQLGGKDFDQKLIDFLLDQFKKKNEIDLRKDVYAMARLKSEAVKCKIALSTVEQTEVIIPMIAEKDGKPLALEEIVTRKQFEDMIKELVERTHDPVDVVLNDSGISEEDLDMVLLVGGSTRIPIIKEDIAKYLGKEPVQAVDPDYAVAEGAAIQAGILSGGLDEDKSLVMTDVNPYTLGIRALSGYDFDYMSVIIPRNTTIPVTREETYYTSWDGQTQAIIEVFQGESSTASDNHHLGTFHIGGIPEREAGKEKIKVAFSYNLNGMLNVSATIASTGNAADITIDMLNRDKEQRMDVSGWKKSELAGDFRTLIRRCEKWLSSKKGDKQNKEEAEEYLYLLKKAIIEGDGTEADIYEDEIRALMEE
ncbi:MAG TPA: hypothetical protein DCZ23_06600 [Lachnospiraceae bacterium]|nr:hypothetical protein [Lachnospiraceae bacterium]